jgi:hypothetical protein
MMESTVRIRRGRTGKGAACALLGLLALATAAHAQFPVEDMDGRSLGLSYTFALQGQNITESDVVSNAVLHQARLGYSPVPYLSLQAGGGINRFSVGPEGQSRFRGDYGFSAYFGAAGYSPALAGLLRGTAGVDMVTLSSEDGRGYRYSALVSNPFLGLIVSPTQFLNAAVGARFHLVDGAIHGPRAQEEVFANSEIVRGYLSLTLKTPFERAFLNLDLDVSPGVETDFSGGPRESTVSMSLGTVLGWKGKSQPSSEKPIYFPAYQEMKDKQKKMAEEIE